MTVALLGNTAGNKWLQDNLVTPAVWLALHVTAPTALGDVTTEVLGDGYVRQRCLFGPPSGKAVVNSDNITFSGMPPVTVSWIAVWSAQNGGFMVLALPVTPFDVGEGFQVLAAVGDIAVQL